MAKNTAKDVATTIDDETIIGFHRNIERERSNSQKHAGEAGALYRSFEKQGGHRAAMQLAMRLKGMGIEKASDFMRAANRYAEVLGLTTGEDLVDRMEADAPADAKEKPKTAKRKPTQRERVVDIEAARAARKLAGEGDADKPAPSYAH